MSGAARRPFPLACEGDETRAQQRAQREARREKYNAWMRGYYRAHREEILARQRARRAEKQPEASARPPISGYWPCS